MFLCKFRHFHNLLQKKMPMQAGLFLDFFTRNIGRYITVSFSPDASGEINVSRSFGRGLPSFFHVQLMAPVFSREPSEDDDPPGFESLHRRDTDRACDLLSSDLHPGTKPIDTMADLLTAAVVLRSIIFLQIGRCRSIVHASIDPSGELDWLPAFCKELRRMADARESGRDMYQYQPIQPHLSIARSEQGVRSVPFPGWTSSYTTSKLRDILTQLAIARIQENQTIHRGVRDYRVAVSEVSVASTAWPSVATADMHAAVTSLLAHERGGRGLSSAGLLGYQSMWAFEQHVGDDGALDYQEALASFLQMSGPVDHELAASRPTG
jgi:hypothetical protein